MTEIFKILNFTAKKNLFLFVVRKQKKCQITEPPIFQLSASRVSGRISTANKISKFACQTSSVEIAAKIVTESTSAICGIINLNKVLK